MVAVLRQIELHTSCQQHPSHSLVSTQSTCLLASSAVLVDEGKVEEETPADDEADGGVQDLPDIRIPYAENILSPVDSLQKRQRRQNTSMF